MARRVVDQIDETVMQELRVSTNQGQVGRQIDLDLALLEAWTQVAQGSGHGIDEIDAFGLELDRTRFDPRHVEQIGYVTLELARLRFDRSDKRCVIRTLAAKLSCRANDSSERRPKIVSDRRQ